MRVIGGYFFWLLPLYPPDSLLLFDLPRYGQRINGNPAFLRRFSAHTTLGKKRKKKE